MLKLVSLLTAFLFIVFTTIAPYGSAQAAARALTTEPQNKTLNVQVFEEEIHNEKIMTFYVDLDVSFVIPYPSHITMIPQLVLVDVFKPPLA